MLLLAINLILSNLHCHLALNAMEPYKILAGTLSSARCGDRNIKLREIAATTAAAILKPSPVRKPRERQEVGMAGRFGPRGTGWRSLR